MDKHQASDVGGIYPARRRTKIDASNFSALRQVRSATVEDTLHAITQGARGIIEQSDDDGLAYEARTVLGLAKSVEAAIAACDARGAAKWALHLGAAVDRLHVLPHVPDAKRGKRMAKGAEKSRRQRGRQLQDDQQRIKATVEKHLRANPRNTLTHARKLAADELDLSIRTVIRHTATQKKS